MTKNIKCDAATSLVEGDMKDDPAMWLFNIIERETVRRPSACLAKYVSFEYLVDNVGTVLQFLGLAEDDEAEWVPTRCLMSIIAEQPARRSRRGGKDKITKDDRDFLAAVYYLATGLEDDENEGDDDEDEENDPPAGDGEYAHDDEYDDYDDYEYDEYEGDCDPVLERIGRFWLA